MRAWPLLATASRHSTPACLLQVAAAPLQDKHVAQRLVSDVQQLHHVHVLHPLQQLRFQICTAGYPVASC